LFEKIQEKTGGLIILITHDFGVVAKIADRIAVMYAEEVIENGDKLYSIDDFTNIKTHEGEAIEGGSFT